MKKLRLFLAAASLASAFVVVGAGPAHATCIGEPVNPCAIVCEIGLSNKHTAPLFRWCAIT
ncbi:MAG: hypothetical protein ABR613_07980 [Actinomycetota bacterium]